MFPLEQTTITDYEYLEVPNANIPDDITDIEERQRIKNHMLQGIAAKMILENRVIIKHEWKHDINRSLDFETLFVGTMKVYHKNE